MSQYVRNLLIALVLLIVAGSLFVWFGVIQSGGNGSAADKRAQDTIITITPTNSNAVTTSMPTTSAVPTNEVRDVKVYFSHNPKSNDTFGYAEFRVKKTNRSDVGTFALEETIKGPSEEDKAQGLYSPIVLSGTSMCEGQEDFTLDITAEGKATLKFCKDISTSGVGDDARVRKIVEYNLKQFDTVKEVVILRKDGNCFGDGSGQNLCK